MTHSLKHVIPAALTAMMLTACGGGGGDTILDQETGGESTNGTTGSETSGTESNTVPGLLSSAYALGAVSSADAYKIVKAMNVALGQHINVDQKYQDGASSSYYTTSGLQTHYAETKTCDTSGSAEYSYSVSSQFLSSSDYSRVYSQDEGVTADYSDCSDDDGTWFFSGSKTTLVDSGTFSFGDYRATGSNQDNAFIEIYNPLYLGNYAGDKTYYTSGNIVTNYKNQGRVVRSDTSSPAFIQYQPINSTYYNNGVAYYEDESSEAVAITLNDFNFDIAYSNGEADLVGDGEIGSSELGYAFDLDVISSLRVANQLLNSNYLDVLTSGTATATGSDGTSIRYEFTTSGFTYSITGYGSSNLITWAEVYPTI